MVDVQEIDAPGYELLLRISDPGCHLTGFICIHSTLLGPALGGIRWRTYGDEDEALEDVKRLAEGMTFKNALAGVPWGGGKSVIVKNDSDWEPQFKSFGQAIETLHGSYIGAEDVGTTTREIGLVAESTAHVVGAHADPSPYTARGVVAAIRAASAHVFGARSLDGRTVAVAGAGKVGAALVEMLAAAGANVVVADPSEAALAPFRHRRGIEVVDPEAIVDTGCDIFAPCAHGAAINSETVGRLNTKIVCGAANNQLATPEDAERLAEHEVLYVPDYLANAGGVISLAAGLEDNPEAAQAAVDRLESRVDELLRLAYAQSVQPIEAARRLVEERLTAAH